MMSWRTNKFVILMRSAGRMIGVNEFFSKLINRSKNYEELFDKNMLSNIRSGDCVWDVGANIGFYSTKFYEIVGPNGLVVAFEPSPENLKKLTSNVHALKTITILPFALGCEEKKQYLIQGKGSGATSRIVNIKTPFSVELDIKRGDSLILSKKVPMPNVIKIDTEGFELEVIEGLGEVLNYKKLRSICIEIHFRLLEERGMMYAPAQIEQILKKSGFDFLWTDPSHIVASRN